MDHNPYEPSQEPGTEPAATGSKVSRPRSTFLVVALFVAVGFMAGWVQGARHLPRTPRHLRCGNIVFEPAITYGILGGITGTVVAAIVRGRNRQREPIRS